MHFLVNTRTTTLISPKPSLGYTADHRVCATMFVHNGGQLYDVLSYHECCHKDNMKVNNVLCSCASTPYSTVNVNMASRPAGVTRALLEG